MKLVFTGIQGCGKGTQARLLVENYNYTLVEMGQELREIAASGSQLGNHIKSVIDSGAQVEAEIVGKVIHEILEKYRNYENIIFDGFIRNEGNKRSFEEKLTDYKVIFFELSKEKSLERLLGRMYNPRTGETFPSHIHTDPKTGETLIKRKDDNEASIRKRIDEFVTKTLPIVELQKAEKKVIEIDANKSIDAVHNELIKKIGITAKK